MYDGLKRIRTINEQIYRLSLLTLVIPVIKYTKTIIEYREPTYSRILDKNVEYWMLQETVGKQKIRLVVILRRIGNGNVTFYSVWKKRDKKLTSKKPSYKQFL